MFRILCLARENHSPTALARRTWAVNLGPKRLGLRPLGPGRVALSLLPFGWLTVACLFAQAQAPQGHSDGLQVVSGNSTRMLPERLELPPPIVTSQTEFEIPFRTDDLNGRLVEVQLYVSTDLGRNWHLYARQSPSTPRIPFTSVGDGEYLFALKTLDRDGRLLPMGQPIPTLRIVVDTVQPELAMQVEPDKFGRIAITWRAIDSNLDPQTFSLSYRVDGPNQPLTWNPLPAGRPATTDHTADKSLFHDRITWQPDATAEAMVLKAEVKDHAGNVTTSFYPIALGSLRSATPPPLLQGRLAGTLSPPSLSASGEGAVTNNRPELLQARQTDSTPPSSLVVAPIDWPSSSNTSSFRSEPSSERDLPVAQQAAAPGSPREAVSRATVQSTLAPLGPQGPAQDLARANESGQNRETRDPFTRPEDLAGQNLVIATGSTLRTPSAAPTWPPSMPPLPTGLAGSQVAEPTDVPRTLPVNPVSQIGNRQPGLPAATTDQSAGAAANAPVDFPGASFRVNTLNFRLRYQVDGLTPAQIGSVSIFGSQDMGNRWELWTTDPDKTSPVEIRVPAAGRYAFRVVITSTTGSSSHIPRPGDAPELIVDVDLDPPSPKITAAPYGRETEQASLVIQWSCEAQDLVPAPIALAYSASPNGPWTTIAAATANSGEFEWPMQPNLPHQVYLKIMATDLAGNRGSSVLESPVNIAPLLPRGRILGLDR